MVGLSLALRRGKKRAEPSRSLRVQAATTMLHHATAVVQAATVVSRVRRADRPLAQATVMTLEERQAGKKGIGMELNHRVIPSLRKSCVVTHGK